MLAMQVERGWKVATVAASTLVLVVLGGCAGAEAPEVPTDEAGVADPTLVEGRELWTAQCSRCHGGDASGGAGPDLQGPWPPDRQPGVDAMATIVIEGRGAMPGFGASLSDEEVDAVVRYVREVL